MVMTESLPPTAVLLIGVFMLKAAELAPAGTVTVAGSQMPSGGSAASDTTTSNGTGLVNVTVPRKELPATTLATLKVIPLSAGFSAPLATRPAKHTRNDKITAFTKRIVPSYEAS